MLKKKLGLILGITVIILLAACAEKSASYTIEENDGISKIVNNKMVAIPFNQEPELILGTDEDEVYFSRISQVCEDSEGNIYILDGGESAITVLSKDGEFIRKIGREGQGPGELNRPERMIFNPAGDIVVADTGNMRFQILDKSGNYLNSFKLEEDSPGYICYDREGRLINHNSSFTWGLSEPVIFTVYDNEFNKTGTFGELIPDDDSTVQHFNNISMYAVNSSNKLIVARIVDNNYTIYQDDKLSSRFSTVSEIEATKVEVEMEKNGDSMSLSIKYNPLCYGLALDSKDRIYALMRNSSSEDEEENSENHFVLDILDPDGIHLSRYSLGQNSYSELYLGKDDKIYLVNPDDATVIRYPGI